MNRPEKINASTDLMYEELIDCFARVDRDEDVRVLIVRGTGKAFCPGADLKHGFLPKIAERKKGLLKDVTEEYSECGALALSRIRKATIAAVNGLASGVGCTLALGCDIRIASEKAKFEFPFLRVGLLPEFGSTYYLSRLVGIGKACELVFTGQTVDAQEIKREDRTEENTA